MLIYAREILTRKPGATFISEVKCSQILYDELNRAAAATPSCARPGTPSSRPR